MNIISIPAFEDNYIWLIQQNSHCVVIDPGDSLPVLAYLKQQHLQLDAILITHHHQDHIGGVNHLASTYSPQIYAPKEGQYDFLSTPVSEGSLVQLPQIGVDFKVLSVPGHTLDHIAYYGANSLFCGDTLFGAGCGRVFEGTPEQMYQSLLKLSKLPPETLIYCAHEYTLKNLEFAKTIEPNNKQLIDRIEKTKSLLSQDIPSIPSTLATELETNPFLRCHIDSVSNYFSLANANPADVFTAVRQAKNRF
jgi:hydroxyacylglutathione hydrolase